MSDPKKFLCTLPIGLAASLLLFLYAVRIQLGVPTTSSAWAQEIIDQKIRAARSIDGPKLVLLGGSATLFGIKASVIESELGIPVINGGLHAGLGMACVLRQGKKMLRPGDTVMLFPEYELLNFGEDNRRHWAAITYLDFILSREPGHYLKLPLNDQIEIALMTPLNRIVRGIKGKWVREKAMSGSEYNPYDAIWLDSCGDMTGHNADHRPLSAEDRDHRICEALVKGISLKEEGFELISDFRRWAKANHVRVMAGFPCMVDRKEYNAATLEDAEEKLSKYYSNEGISLVGGLRESLLHEADFFDTIYHPIEEVSIIRGKNLSEQLRPLIGFARP